nr:MAG TPA: hypothetical protein [Caudoviricetes sp.]
MKWFRGFVFEVNWGRDFFQCRHAFLLAWLNRRRGCRGLVLQ